MYELAAIVLLFSLLSLRWDLALSECFICQYRWATFDGGEDDPHIILSFKDNTLDRPLCYDLLGQPGEVYSMWKVHGEWDITGTLIPSPPSQWHKFHRNHQATYFGGFHFAESTGLFSVNITTHKVTIETKNGRRKTEDWRNNHTSNPLLFDGFGLRVVRVANIIKVVWKKQEFIVKMTMEGYRKYQAQKIKDKFYFLGIYMKKDPKTQYDGLVGQFANQSAEYKMENGRHYVVHHGTSVEVLDHQIKDQLHNKKLKCWFVQDYKELTNETPSRFKL